MYNITEKTYLLLISQFFIGFYQSISVVKIDTKITEVLFLSQETKGDADWFLLNKLVKEATLQ